MGPGTGVDEGIPESGRRALGNGPSINYADTMDGDEEGGENTTCVHVIVVKSLSRFDHPTAEII